MLSFPPTVRVFVCRESVDMRKSYDGLCGCVEQLLNQDPLSGHLFVFFNRRGSMVKILVWDRSGFCIYAKRLEQGRFAFRRQDEHETGHIDYARLLLILEGIDLRHSHQRKRFSIDCCGKPLTVIDRKSHLVVERKPAQYTATRYVRPVYGCSCCKDTVHVAEPVALPIAKGLAGPGLLLFVLTGKYQYHLPLYRIQRQIYHESRIWFTRSTLVCWVRQVSTVLDRIHKGLLEAYRRSRIKHADESPFQVKVEGHYRECWMWTGLSGDGRTAVFLYNMRRTGAAAKLLLAGGSPGDYLMVDDCPSYNCAVRELRLIVLHCMVHIRRKFVEALKAGKNAAFNSKVLIKIGQLYRIERFAKKHGLSDTQRGELRKKYSAPILEGIHKLLLDPGFTVLPQSLTGIAILHFRNNWKEATRFIESGDLPIDNSANERIIRPFAIGRNNWGQAGSENGANWMACLYSIITTCKLRVCAQIT